MAQHLRIENGLQLRRRFHHRFCVSVFLFQKPDDFRVALFAKPRIFVHQTISVEGCFRALAAGGGRLDRILQHVLQDIPPAPR